MIFHMSFWLISDFHIRFLGGNCSKVIYPCSVDSLLSTAGLKFFNKNKFSASKILFDKNFKGEEENRHRLNSFKYSFYQTAFLAWSFCANLGRFHQSMELCRLELKYLLCLIQYNLEWQCPMSVLYKHMMSSSFFGQNNY